MTVDPDTFDPRHREFLRDFDRVEGWLHYPFLRVIAALDLWHAYRHYAGAMCEIGVYKGKSLAALACVARPDEFVVGVDCFDLPDANRSRSGIGASQGEAMAVLERFAPHVNPMWVVADSLTLTREDLPARPYRLFSIDGGHSAEETEHDLALAASTSHDLGFIIVDDVENEDWPDVRQGFLNWLLRTPGWKPVFTGMNKVVLARRHHADFVRRFLSMRVTGSLREFVDSPVWSSREVGLTVQ